MAAGRDEQIMAYGMKGVVLTPDCKGRNEKYGITNIIQLW